MKKASVMILPAVCVLLLAALIGFYLYRNLTSTPLHIQKLHGAVSANGDGTAADTATDHLLNVNTADLSQLSALPGIGPVLAQRIIDYRNANGDFRSPADLLNVSGIGEGTLEAILDLITMGGNT